MSKEGLTTKQRLFVESYLSNGFNATEAARTAGYKAKDDHSLASIGYENLRKLEISKVVQERVNESAMSANEVLQRLSDIASGKIADMVDENGNFNLNLAKERKKDQLLKKLKVKRTSKKVDTQAIGEDEESETLETSLIHEEVEFEMYSAHEALRDLGKYHKLFTERHEHTGKDGADLFQNITVQIIDGSQDK